MDIQRRCVLVCQGRSCQRNGASEVLEEFRRCTGAMAPIFVAECDCTGQCSSGPTVRVTPDQSWYCRVRPNDVGIVVDEHLVGDRPVESLLHPRFHPRLESFTQIDTPPSDDDDREPNESES
ncbi:MAG: (2Fe-2S) ferredoxin domain-containing protein [Leptolyngbyaceae bacterium]|nr:(2Fe-2S) ferredoxin domain-containing protein [Leptolyngbyaceae bacterium]